MTETSDWEALEFFVDSLPYRKETIAGWVAGVDDEQPRTDDERRAFEALRVLMRAACVDGQRLANALMRPRGGRYHSPGKRAKVMEDARGKGGVRRAARKHNIREATIREWLKAAVPYPAASPETRAWAVREMMTTDRPRKDIAYDAGVSPAALRNWLADFEPEKPMPGLEYGEFYAELRRLQAECSSVTYGVIDWVRYGRDAEEISQKFGLTLKQAERLIELAHGS